MPIRYTRVGWQDAPSLDTPIDAANLNHMDNGILALAEEMDTDLPVINEKLDALENVSSELEDIKARLTAVEGGIRSHVGQIIMSATLDTEAKVIEMYGGSEWTSITGRFLLGASGSYPVGSSGGSKNAIVPNHTHKVTYTDRGTSAVVTPVPVGTGVATSVVASIATSLNSNTVTSNQPANGQSVTNANMPPYIAVYIWQRVA